MHILDVHGDLLEGWSLHILTSMHVSNKKAGIIGANLRMREVLAFMSIGISSLQTILLFISSPDSGIFGKLI